jgi:hypothetical protein
MFLTYSFSPFSISNCSRHEDLVSLTLLPCFVPKDLSYLLSLFLSSGPIVCDESHDAATKLGGLVLSAVKPLFSCCFFEVSK